VSPLLTAEDNGTRAGERGWSCNLPVVLVPGFCSSGLRITKSDLMPGWANERIWFSLQKLGASKGGAGASRLNTVAAVDGEPSTNSIAAGNEYAIAVHVHGAMGLPLDVLHDNPKVVLEVKLIGKKQKIICERVTTAILCGTRSHGTVMWDENITLTKENPGEPVKLHFRIVDDDEWLTPNFGSVTVRLAELQYGQPSKLELTDVVSLRTTRANDTKGQGEISVTGRSQYNTQCF
jgi:hypothetical protein